MARKNKGAAATAPEFLGPKQAAKYEKMLRNQGPQAAQQYAAKIEERKGAAGTDPAQPVKVDRATQQQQVGGQVNQTGPGGSQTWSFDPVTGRPTVQTQLDQNQQQLFDQQAATSNTALQGANQNLQQAINQGQLNFNNAPQMPQAMTQQQMPQMPQVPQFNSVQAPQFGGFGQPMNQGGGQMRAYGGTAQGAQPIAMKGGGMSAQGPNMGSTLPQVNLPNSYSTQNMFSQDRNRIEEGLYGRATKYLDRDKTQASEDFQQQMANRGIQFGSDQYNKAQEQFDRNWNDRYEDARTGAIAQAGQEQSNLFGMGQGQFGSEMALRGQGVGEQAQQFGMGMQANQQQMMNQQQGFSQGMQTRQQGINEASQLYNQPFVNAGQFMGNYGGVQAPAFQASVSPFTSMYGQQQQQGWQGQQNQLDREQQQWMNNNQRFAPHAPNYSVQTTQMQIEAARQQAEAQRQHEIAMAGMPG